LEKVKVVIENLNHQEIAIFEPQKSIIFHIGQAGIDWMQACGQKGRCTTCAFQILEGDENLSSPTESEIRFADQGKLPAPFRLACQACAIGNVRIKVPDSLKLPHISYSS
jgi:2Fe-2S ferredoxin